MKLKQYVQSRLLFLLLILMLSFAVRALTTHFIHDHLADPGWFQSGTYALFDQQAQEILDHKSAVFWIDDPSRTETAIYPPGYPLLDRPHLQTKQRTICRECAKSPMGS